MDTLPRKPMNAGFDFSNVAAANDTSNKTVRMIPSHRHILNLCKWVKPEIEQIETIFVIGKEDGKAMSSFAKIMGPNVQVSAPQSEHKADLIYYIDWVSKLADWEDALQLVQAAKPGARLLFDVKCNTEEATAFVGELNRRLSTFGVCVEMRDFRTEDSYQVFTVLFELSPFHGEEAA